MEPEILLRFALKRLNDTISPNGVVLSLLVFGTLSTLPMLNKNTAGQKQRKDALRNAREEVANIREQQKLVKIIRSKLPPAARYKHRNGDLVYALVQKGRISYWI